MAEFRLHASRTLSLDYAELNIINNNLCSAKFRPVWIRYIFLRSLSELRKTLTTNGPKLFSDAAIHKLRKEQNKKENSIAPFVVSDFELCEKLYRIHTGQNYL